MSVINLSLPADGETIEAADYNSPINTWLTDYNGNITNDNISASAAIAGSKLSNSSVAAGKIDFGGAGVGVWWEEIGRTTLGVAADTITVSSIPARTHLLFIIFTLNTGGTHNVGVRFNSDSAASYAYRFSDNGAVDVTGPSQTELGVASGTVSQLSYTVLEALNVAASEKVVMGQSVRQGTAGAANVPTKFEMMGKWANTSAQINRIDVVNTAGTGDYAAASKVIVLGHN